MFPIGLWIGERSCSISFADPPINKGMLSMIVKLALAVPAAALTALTMAAGMVATSDSAEAGCYRVGAYPRAKLVCESTPKPDRPNQQLK